MFRGCRRKPATISLVNLADFAKIRQEKEIIINNPFEQNWKKAIAIQELLHLHRLQQHQTRPTQSTPNRLQYLSWAGRPKTMEDSEQWDDNQDNQVNKYIKMVEGLGRWQKQYHEVHIGKVMGQIDQRQKSKATVVKPIAPVKQKSVKTKISKISGNLGTKKGAMFIKLMHPRNSCCTDKHKEVQRLKNNATTKYGVNFRKEGKQNKMDFDLQEFKRLDKEILTTFMSSMRDSRISFEQPLVEDGGETIQSDKVDIAMLRTMPLSTVKVHQSAKAINRKRYLRIE